MINSISSSRLSDARSAIQHLEPILFYAQVLSSVTCERGQASPANQLQIRVTGLHQRRSPRACAVMTGEVVHRGQRATRGHLKDAAEGLGSTVVRGYIEV